MIRSDTFDALENLAYDPFVRDPYVAESFVPTVLPLADEVPHPKAQPAPGSESTIGARKRRRPVDLPAAARRQHVRGNLTWQYQLSKRLIDVLGGMVLLVSFGPLMLVSLVVLTITTRGRPIFSQRRVGRNGREFTLYKFRTMYLNAEQRRDLVANEKSGPVFKNRLDPRITPLGRLLRQTSIDEMPQLINVLRGEMSLVGPRPPLPKEVALYQAWQRQRLLVKPGLTCLWQVSGRSEIEFDDWVRMDIWYIRNQSVATDLQLLLRTPLSVLSCRGAY